MWDYPSSYAYDKNAREDFAESVMVNVWPASADPDRPKHKPDGLPMSPGRIRYVNLALQTIIDPKNWTTC